MVFLLPSKVGLDEACSNRIIFSLHETVIYFLLFLSIGSWSNHGHNILLFFRRWRQRRKRFHRWPRRLFLYDSRQLINWLIVLAWDFKGALRTSAIVNQITFDWPAAEPLVHELASCVILFTYCVMRGCLNWSLDHLVIGATMKRLRLRVSSHHSRCPHCIRSSSSSWIAIDIACNKATSALVVHLIQWLSLSCCSRIIASWRYIKGPTWNVLWIKFLVRMWLRWLSII